MQDEIHFFDRLTAAMSYLLLLPALRVILTEKRKNEYLALHAAQALFYWTFSFILIVAVRIAVDYVMTRTYISPFESVIPSLLWAIWLYSIYCCILALLGRQINIPLVSSIAKKVA
jgi:uncharacterized membrane protein